jgi:hypothetical protein
LIDDLILKKSSTFFPHFVPHVFRQFLALRGEDSTRFVTASWDATMHVFDLTRKELDTSLSWNWPDMTW